VALADTPEAQALLQVALATHPTATFVDRSRWGDGPLPAGARPLDGDVHGDQLVAAIVSALDRAPASAGRGEVR
jgi:hypothetical protein